MKILITFCLTLFVMPTTFAVTCEQIHNQAKPSAKAHSGKAKCVLQETEPGISRGSTVSVYWCGTKKYELTRLENTSCTVKSIK